MSKKENLTQEEAVEKLTQIAKDAKVCMFSTDLNNSPFAVRPMTVQKVDEDGKIYFLSSKNSDTNKDILKDSHVQLVFSDHSGSKYMSVYGSAIVSVNPQTIDYVWEPLAKAWFPEGKQDPNLTVLEVTPSDSKYWETEDGKLVYMAKVVFAALTGNKVEGGVEGKLHV